MKTPVDCGTCGARALVEKFSWEHTTVEWESPAHEVCIEIVAASREEGILPARVPKCTAMQQAIRAAVVAGDIVVDEAGAVSRPSAG